MPPSPQEIKARLDKVVDQEGNVLDMGTVLDIVSILERVSITKEALETTRIGRVINLLRKKTNNEELAKRAKKLVKKWQKLVSNHFKNLSKAVDSPANSSRISTPILQLNGVTKESTNFQESSQPSAGRQTKSGVKRKRISAQTSSANDKIDTAGSEILNSQSDLLHHTTDLVQSCQSNDASNTDNEIENGTCDGSLMTQSQQCDGSTIIKSKGSCNNDQCVANSNQAPCEDNECIDNNDSSTKIQSLITYDANWYHSANSVMHEPASAIPEENLAVRRKPIQDNIENPLNMVDGINGCFDEDDRWCYWTDIVLQNQGQLPIHPYVTLD